MPDVKLRIWIEVKNDGVTTDAGIDNLGAVLQEAIEERLKTIPWVIDMLVTRDHSGEAN